MTSLRKRFGQLLAAQRKRRGLRQADLAEKSRLSVDMIAKLETGVTAPSFASIERLAEALEIDPAELFTPRAGGKPLSAAGAHRSGRRHLPPLRRRPELGAGHHQGGTRTAAMIGQQLKTPRLDRWLPHMESKGNPDSLGGMVAERNVQTFHQDGGV